MGWVVSVEEGVALGQRYTVLLNLLEISVPDSSREGGGSTKKAMKDAIFSLEGRSALGGSTAFQVIRRGCTCTVVSTQWPRHDKSPSGKPPWQGLWGPVGKPSPRIWSPFPWGLITIAALICSRLPTSGTVHQRKSIPETLETPKGEGTGVPLAHRHPAGECVGGSGRGLSQREP